MVNAKPALAWVLLAALSLGISGCAKESGNGSPTSTDTPTASTSPSSSQTSTTGSTLPPPAQLASIFDWTSCTGLGVGVEMVTPLFNAPRPKDWSASQDNNAAAGTLVYGLYKCERVSWGPFERGPVFIMQEWHSDFETPSGCAEGDHGRELILSAIWFSDADLAAYARSEAGMPAEVADISFDLSAMGDAEVHHWIWNLAAGEPSDASFTRTENDLLLHTFEPSWRLFWADGAGVGYMDFDAAYKTPEPQAGEAHGTLAPPMLYGTSMPNSAFVTAGQTDLILEGSFTGAISRFSDPQCATPL